MPLTDHARPDASPSAEVTSREGFRERIAPHWDAMCRVAARLARASERDDVLQNALLLAWQRSGQFDPQRGSERNWLLAIVANEARRSYRAPSHLELIDLDRPVDAVEPDLDLRRAVASLAERQRVAIELHYYVGLAVADVARVMGCAEGTIKSTLSAARNRLRTMLQDEETP